MRAHADDLRQVTGDGALAEAIARNWRDARISPRERAMLEYAEKVAQDARALGTRDVEALRASGFDDGDVLEIVHVVGFFCGINRIVDALGIDPEP